MQLINAVHFTEMLNYMGPIFERVSIWEGRSPYTVQWLEQLSNLVFSAASTPNVQSLQPTEVQVDPPGLNSSVTTTHTLTGVGAGSYSVSVMAANKNGMSREMTATFVVQGVSVNMAVCCNNVVLHKHCL